MILITILSIKVFFIDEPSNNAGLNAASGIFMFIVLPLVSIAFCLFGYDLLKTMRKNWISLKQNKDKFSLD